MSKATQIQGSGPQAICASVQELGARWSAAQGGSAVLLWRFAHSVLAFQSANPKVKLADIGASCANACKREKPYSKGWVSRAVKAARAIGHEPRTPEEATKFCDLFHGNNPARKSKSKANPSAEEALKAAIAFAKRAVKLGLDSDTVLETLAEELDSAADETTAQAA
jgi:hypothetical protein